jgi:O-glycosyl hydrolase
MEDNMRKHGLLFLAVPLLMAALLLTSCSAGEGTQAEKKYSATPVISVHPTSVDYVGANPAIADLKVTVTVSDMGVVTYQWYEATTYTNTSGTLINGATEATLTPDMGDKTESFFYVVITNTKEGVSPMVKASNPARIRVLAEAEAAPTVTVNISTTNAQYIRGFGGMSNAFGINPADTARYMELKDIDTMFNPDTGLGFNILRIMIWPNPLEQVLSGQIEPQMGNQITYLEVVKRVNRYGGYVLASPWTPPPQWKVNESEAGTEPSHLLPQYYGSYAQYLKTYAQNMARYGAPIYTLSIQNEPSFPASYAGCKWTPEQQLAFFQASGVGKFLNGVSGYGGGESLESVLVMSGEPHQNVTFNDAVKNNAVANALVDIYAYHIYGSMNGPYTDVQADNANGRKEVWMTEHNINSGAGLETQDFSWNFVWRVADEIDHVIRVNSSNAFVWWYLKRYYSMIGENAYGTVNGQVMPRGYVMSHWAKYATDAVRVPAVVSGHPGGGNANDAGDTGNTSNTVKVKASAYRKKASPSSWVERQVKRQEDSVSMVIYDNRTEAGTAGQNIRVNLPADFGTAKYAHAIISDAERKHAPHLVVLNGTTADFFLPANSIVSIKFSK